MKAILEIVRELISKPHLLGQILNALIACSAFGAIGILGYVMILLLQKS